VDKKTAKKKAPCLCPKTFKLNQGPTYCFHAINADLRSAKDAGEAKQ